MRLLVASALLTVAAGLWQPATAQYAMTQDSTIKGLQKVYVNWQMTPDAVSPQTAAQLADFINLELRKAGLRVAKTPDEVDMSKDAVLNIGLIKLTRSLSTDLALRMDVEQRATLVRTGEQLQMVTWYHEDDRRNVVVDQVVQPMVKAGVDKFIRVWLDTNGR